MAKGQRFEMEKEEDNGNGAGNPVEQVRGGWGYANSTFSDSRNGSDFVGMETEMSTELSPIVRPASASASTSASTSSASKSILDPVAAGGSSCLSFGTASNALTFNVNNTINLSSSQNSGSMSISLAHPAMVTPGSKMTEQESRSPCPGPGRGPGHEDVNGNGSSLGMSWLFQDDDGQGQGEFHRSDSRIQDVDALSPVEESTFSMSISRRHGEHEAAGSSASANVSSSLSQELKRKPSLKAIRISKNVKAKASASSSVLNSATRKPRTAKKVRFVLGLSTESTLDSTTSDSNSSSNNSEPVTEAENRDRRASLPGSSPKKKRKSLKTEAVPVTEMETSSSRPVAVAVLSVPLRTDNEPDPVPVPEKLEKRGKREKQLLQRSKKLKFSGG